MSRAGAVGAVAGAVLAGLDNGATLRIGTVTAVDTTINEVQLDIFEDGWLPCVRRLRPRVNDRVMAIMQGPVGVVTGLLGVDVEPLQRSVTVARQLTAADRVDAPNLPTPDGERWPALSPTLRVWVPEWATTCAFEATWHGVEFDGTTNAAGFVWIFLGTLKLASGRWNAATGTTIYRDELGTADDFEVPSEMRGTWQDVEPWGGTDSSASGTPVMDSGSSFSATFTFTE